MVLPGKLKTSRGFTGPRQDAHVLDRVQGGEDGVDGRFALEGGFDRWLRVVHGGILGLRGHGECFCGFDGMRWCGSRWGNGEVVVGLERWFAMLEGEDEVGEADRSGNFFVICLSDQALLIR